jgi:hypothetical protein
VFELEYEKDPELFDNGAVMAKAVFPKVFVGMEKFEMVGATLLTTIVAVVVADVCVDVSVCVAVIVALPTPTTVIVLLATVATAIFEVVYVIVPLLFVVGAVIVNAASPYVFAGTEKSDNTVFVLLTTRVDVTEPES